MRGIAVLLLILLFTSTFATTVFGATTGQVSATVTAQSVAVTVSPGTVTYGTLTLSASKDTTATGTNQTQTATNTGNIAEDFTISSSNAVGGTAWTISATSIGADQYMHSFSVNSGSTWTAMNTTPTSMATNVASNGTSTFDLKINTPSSTTDYTQKTVTVTVTASAH